MVETRAGDTHLAAVRVDGCAAVARFVEGIANRTDAAPWLRTACAPAAPAGKQAMSPARRTDSPSGVRSVSSPSITISHSSSVASKWYGHNALPGSSS